MPERSSFLAFWGVFIAVAATHVAMLSLTLSEAEPPPPKKTIKKIRLQMLSALKTSVLPKGPGLGFAPGPKSAAPSKVVQQPAKPPVSKKKSTTRDKKRTAVVPLKQAQFLAAPPVRDIPEPPSEEEVETVGKTHDGGTSGEGGTPGAGGSGASGYGVGGGEGTPGDLSGQTVDIEQLYMLYLQGTLQKVKHYPVRARKMHMQGRVEVTFIIAKDGRIGDVRISAPSTHELLNKTTEQAVRDIGYVRPLPPELGQDALEVTVPFDYVLK
jgi:TonB family protein